MSILATILRPGPGPAASRPIAKARPTLYHPVTLSILARKQQKQTPRVLNLFLV